MSVLNYFTIFIIVNRKRFNIANAINIPAITAIKGKNASTAPVTY